MSQTSHLIANNISAPGFWSVDNSRSLPCVGVSRRVSAFSSGSSLGENSLLTRVKFISHKRVSKAASILCGARPGNNRGNSDFSNLNGQGFSSDRNWADWDGDNNDEISDEADDILPSKNGAPFSSASSLKSLANAEPGQKDKDVVELFRKVQKKLLVIEKEKQQRARAATEEVKTPETVKGKDNDKSLLLGVLGKQQSERAATEKVKTPETVKGKDNDKRLLMDVLGNLANVKGSEKLGASNNGSAAFGKKVTSGFQNEGKSQSSSILNALGRNITREPKASHVTRPASSFRRRSPVPSMKYEPVYINEDDDSDLEEEQQSEQDEQPESGEELESEHDPVPGPISFLDDDEYRFADVAKDEPSEEDDADEQPTQHEDLSSLKLAELRALAKSRGVKGFSKLKKSELAELLSRG